MKAGKKYGTAPEYVTSNGAFKMTKWQKGKSVDFEKNESYYNASVKMKNLHMDLDVAQAASLIRKYRFYDYFHPN